MIKTSIAKFKIGQVIRHRVHAFRGVVFDVDAEFADGRGTPESISCRAAVAQGPAVLLSSGRERPKSLRRLRLRAESDAGHIRRAGSSSTARRFVRAR